MLPEIQAQMATLFIKDGFVDFWAEHVRRSEVWECPHNAGEVDSNLPAALTEHSSSEFSGFTFHSATKLRLLFWAEHSFPDDMFFQ